MSTGKLFNINDEYRITSDSYQFIVQKKFIIDKEGSKNNGQIDWRNEAYLPQIQDVLRFFMDLGIKENLDDIHMIKEYFDDMTGKFNEFLEAYKDRKGLK